MAPYPPDRIVKIDGQPSSDRSHRISAGRHRIEVVTSRYIPGEGYRSVGAGEVAAGVTAEVLSRAVPVVGLAAAVTVLAATGAARDGETRFASYTKESPPLAVCFIARPGRTYQLRTSAQLSEWLVELFDERTSYNVASPCRPPPVQQESPP